jgi:polysaccharide biosynthesis transport protein
VTGLGRRSIIVTGVVCAALTALLLSSTYPRVYSSVATLLLRDDLDVRDEAVFIESEAMRDHVAERLGVDSLPPPATAITFSDAQLVEIVIESGDAITAATVANAYAESYIELREPIPDPVGYESAMADLRQSITGTTETIAALDAKGELSPEDQLLREIFVEQLADFEQQLDTLEGDPDRLGEVEMVPAATIDDPASVPGSPDTPKVVRLVLLAAAAGLVIGLIAWAILNRLDDTLRRPNDVAALRRRTPIIGRIPHDPSLQRRPATTRRRIDDTSLTSVHALRDEVLFLGLDEAIRVIQVCGASKGAGATTIATELALALSEYSTVALVDLDLRSPNIHRMVGFEGGPGLVDVLDDEPIDMTLHPVNERLAVIGAGRPPARPLGLLSRVRLDTMVDELRDRFDVVVLDTPDMAEFGDSTMIARLADAVIVVTRLGHTSAAEARSACRELDRVRAPILGFVVNDI